MCHYFGIPPKTLQNWRKTGMQDKRKGSARHVAFRLSEEEQELFYQQSISPRFRGSTVEQIVATLAEEGCFIASSSTLYRILRKRNALQHRQNTKKPRASRAPEKVTIFAKNQVWTWDITWMKTEVDGLYKYAYTIMDLFDRSIVGWSIEDKESDVHSSKLFSRVMRDLKVLPQIVHADNGHPMKGVTLAVFLDSLHISRSYSRPRQSNDNAHIESYHKTLKYSVGYPSRFTSLEHCRSWYAEFVHWYNTEHQHSGLGYVTPHQMRTGEAIQIHARRNETIALARQNNPLRWRTSKIRVYQKDEIKFDYRPIKKAV
jgi:putative transposase